MKLYRLCLLILVSAQSLYLARNEPIALTIIGIITLVGSAAALSDDQARK